MNLPVISFIIPAYNEEQLLAQTITTIKQHLPSTYTYEIIVVDHGSQDDTISIAERQGATVYVKRDGSIAGLRNYGVRHSSGYILIFLDADVLLTDSWAETFPKVFESCRTNPLTVTGSWVGVPDRGSWIERFWFAPLAHERATHVNTGHLITTKTLFQVLGGFAEDLETGEDYDFSTRAKAAAAIVTNNPALSVVHLGYPKILRDFVRREMWHGKGDWSKLKTVFESKVVLLSVFFAALHGMILISLALRPSVTSISTGIFLVGLICVASSIAKYRRHGLLKVVVNSFLYYCYFWARGLSLILVALEPALRKRHRATTR